MAIFDKDFSSENKHIFIFKDKEMLVKKRNSTELPDSKLFEELKSRGAFKISIYDSFTQAVAAELPSDFDISSDLFEDYVFIFQRQYFFDAGAEKGALSARLKSYVKWLDSTKFCCSCGSKLELYKEENALYCPSCKKIHYPRIEPCIIVLIHKEDKVLLLKHTYRNQNMYTCLAGFMEVGESVEQCVVREVNEEVGIEITNLRYAGSQGWPFPDQLMLAFHADYKGGELKLQESEIAEASWLKIDEVTNLPPPGSVAWNLINNKL